MVGRQIRRVKVKGLGALFFCLNIYPYRRGKNILLFGLVSTLRKVYTYPMTTNRENTVLNATVETASRDCDGLYTGGHTMTMTDAERTEEFGDLNFIDRVVSSLVNAYSLMEGATATLRVERGSDFTRLTWNEPTDEGFREAVATICEGEGENESWQRDHSAEAMGY